MEGGATPFNHIHFVYIGRLKDARIMLSTLTNNLMQSRLSDFQSQAQLILKKQVSSVTTDNMRLKSE